MKTYSLLVGSNNARGSFGRRDEKILQDITARHFKKGCTILAADGSWYDADAKVYRREEARQILVCTNEPRRLRPWCVELGKALRQKELLLIEIGPVRRFRFAEKRTAK